MHGISKENSKSPGCATPTGAETAMEHTQKDGRPTCIVGIGASAGGLQALKRFFDNTPADSGMAFVVIQHLSPGFKSQMAEILKLHTRMPIRLIKDDCPIEPDHVYLIPSLSQVTIQNGCFSLGENLADEHLHLPIDCFFSSLAQQGGKGVGVILSGTGKDGSQGAVAIHEAGGLVIVQSPESARYDGMPQSAVDTGLCDVILPPDRIPAALLMHLADQLQPRTEVVDKLDRIRPQGLPEPPREPAGEASDFDAGLCARQQISDLEAELHTVREALKVTREQLQNSMEEQQTTIEEFQVTNEELQATNEELNSTNEELQSLNAEFVGKNLEFRRLSVEHDNMLSSIDSGMIFLDRQMCVRRFNPAIVSFFTLLPQDVGRSIDDIAFRLADRTRLQEDIRRVLVDAVQVVSETVDHDGKSLLIRITPFRTESGQVDGVVITFTDVSKVRDAEETVQRLNEELRKSNEKLEKRVLARTRELEKSRAELESQNLKLDQTCQEARKESAGRLQAVEELRKKELLLLQQSRLAAMGEMLANIAHQWRQPMNMLGLKIQQIGLSYELGGFSKELLDSNIEKAMEILYHLSQTIDDFRNFSAPDKEKSLFRVDQMVAKTVSLVEENFKTLGIEIRTEMGGDPQINGYQNEYCQVLLNLLMNAKDAFQGRGAGEAWITIRSRAEGRRVVMTVADNAGGIKDEIIEKIFDPYFTTKELGKGTGVGLFMSKTIIEKNMGGRLSVRNLAGGVEFRVEV